MPTEQFCMPGEQFCMPGEQFCMPGKQFCMSGEQACLGRNFVCRGSNFVCPGSKHARGAVLHARVWPSRISSHFWPDKDEALLVGLHRSQKSSKKQISSWEASKMKHSWSVYTAASGEQFCMSRDSCPWASQKFNENPNIKKLDADPKTYAYHKLQSTTTKTAEKNSK